MAVTRYNSKDVTVTVANLFITGFAEGSFVSSEKNEDNSGYSVGAQGDVAVNETNDPTGLITLTVQQTSPSVKVLNDLANSGKIVPAWVIHQGTPKEKSGGSQCRVARPAAKEYSNEVESREFEIQVYDYISE